MNNKTNETVLPQGGTSCTAAGESATLHASSPSYSGGGNVSLDIVTPLASGNTSRGGSRSASSEDLTRLRDRLVKLRGAGTIVKFASKKGVESDSDSASSERNGASATREIVGAAESSKLFRKRPRSEDGQGSSSDEEFASACKVPTPTSRRGKGRGHEGRRLAEQATERAAQLTEEERHPGVSSPRASLLGSSGDEPEADGGPEQGRKTDFVEAVKAAVRDVAMKRTQASKNRAIVAAAASILAAAEANYRAPPSDETALLQAKVARLEADTELLRKENERLRAGLRGAGTQEVPPGGRGTGQSRPEPAENQVLDLVRQELAAFRERFSVLEGIVLRPPLAASQKASGERAASYAAAVAAKPGASSAPAKPASGKPVLAKQKKGGAAAQAAQAPAPVVQQPPPTQPSDPSAAEAGGQVAGEKKKRAGKAARAAKKRDRKRRQKERRVAAVLRAPKTAAVVLTLQPDAVKRGVSYADVLLKAKEAVDLRELGIVGGLRLKVTMTGARMLEIPGADSAPSADALAERLRASLSADDARVSRPTKCADIRILGLDDSVTEEEVVAAVVRMGGCAAEQVKVGNMRPDYTGMRTVVVSCPVTAAKSISEGRRLLVGWVSAQVKLLEPRPLRCFRCQVGNHVGAVCTSEVDRSGLCFRCGQPGHQAGSCEATPHCVVCAAAGKPANHRLGGKACDPPAKAGSKKKPSASAVSAAVAAVTAAPVPSQGDQGEAAGNGSTAPPPGEHPA